MKFKHLLLGLMILMVASSIAAISADEAIIEDFKFTVPDNFTIVNSTEHFISLAMDDDHSIDLSVPDDAMTADQFKANLEREGYKFDNESMANFTSDIFNIDAINLTQGKSHGVLYFCDDVVDVDEDDDLFVVYLYPADEGDIDPLNNTVTDMIGNIVNVDD